MMCLLTYHSHHTFDLMLSCPKCGTFGKFIYNLLLSEAVNEYNNWRLLCDCSWCGGGDGIWDFAGCYYRAYGLYLPFPYLKIVSDPVEIRRLVDELEFSPETMEGFAIHIPTQPYICVRTGKILWNKYCAAFRTMNKNIKTNTSKGLYCIQRCIFIDDFSGIVLNKN